MILYVMHEHPSVSQTFVVLEAAAVEALDVPVVGYALRRGTARQSAADLDFLCRPPSLLQLLTASVRAPAPVGRALRRFAAGRLPLKETTRLILAELHAAHVSPLAARAGVTHIHAHFVARPADVAHALARRLGCRWTATAHAADIFAPKEIKLLGERLRSAELIACESVHIQRVIMSQAATDEVETAIVHNGVDLQGAIFRAATARTGSRHIVTVGRLVATKGYWTILDAAAEIMTKDAELTWSLIGDGPLREALSRDHRYQELQPRLKMTGALTHSATLSAIREADAFVLPCEQDGTVDADGIPNVLMEAMAMGIPVITTDISGIPELVIPEETGFLVQPRDPSALAAAIWRVLYTIDAAAIDRIRHTARVKVEDEFESSSQARVLIDLLKPYLARGEVV